MSIIYHELVNQVKSCKKCDKNWRCYSYKTPNIYIIENICPNPKVVEAIKKIQTLRSISKI